MMDNKETNSSNNDQIENNLKDCFRKIVEGKTLELDLEELNVILKNSFQIYKQCMNTNLKMILPYMLVHFMKTWPGWQKGNHYIKKQITFESWFNKFKEYLLYKIKYMIKNDFDKAMQFINKSPDVDSGICSKIDNATQTTVGISDKIISPYTIEIKAPPRQLNSLVFCEGPNDSILIKECQVNTMWTGKLKPRQLINWPFIDVEYNSAELHFKRSNIHEFQRFLTLSSDKFALKKNPFIEEADIINKNLPRQAFTINTLKEYCNSLMSIKNKHKQDLSWTEDYWLEVETILEDFILDLVDIGINGSIATNTFVVFNIGKSIYARNKRIKRNNQSVSLVESVKPRVQLSLFSFDAIKYKKGSPTFKHLDVGDDGQEMGSVKKFVPCIKYTCTYCQRTYSSCDDMWKHLKKIHTIEQHVLCFKCKLEYKIMNLTENRWGHCCKTI